MQLPQLSLRTLFWLVFAAAIAIGWGWERWGYLAQFDEYFGNDLFLDRDSAIWPSLEAAARRTTLKRLAKLSDQALREEYSAPRMWHSHDLHPAEMARRGMVNDLRSLLEAAAPDPLEEDVELLTALRRAEGKPDPVQITIKFVDRGWRDEPFASLHVEGVVRNADVDRRTFTITGGCDDRGGRHDRWRVELRDVRGQRVPDANYGMLRMGGGIGTTGRLKYGGILDWGYVMDPRSYIRPPPSGRYQLQLIHANGVIADDPDLTGLIVWKSEPIWVEVVNRDEVAFDFTAIRLILVTLLALLTALASYLLSPPREEDSWTARWQDWVPCLIVIALAIGWWCDLWQLRTSLARLRPDSEANWTIVDPAS